MSTGHTHDSGDLLRSEHARIQEHRRNRGVPARGNHVGLALSGGSARAAAFCLGVVQSLDNAQLFRYVDYLSTVSGGGYIGTSLSWYLRGGEKDFPFADQAKADSRHRDGDEGERRLELIRQHDQRLAPGTQFDGAAFGDGGNRAQESPRPSGAGIDALSVASLLIQSAFLSLFVYGSLLVMVFVVLASLDALFEPARAFLQSAAPWAALRKSLEHAHFATAAATVLLAWVSLVFVWYSLGTYLHDPIRRGDPESARMSTRRYEKRLRLQRRLGRYLKWIVVLLVMGLTPAVNRVLHDSVESWIAGGGTGVVGVLFAVIATFAVVRSGQKRASETSRIRAIRRFVLRFAGGILVLSLVFLSHSVASAILDGGSVGILWVVLGLALLVGLMSNVNLLGLNRLHRDRLMEAFMAGPDAVRQGTWRPAVDADRLGLAQVCGADTVGPYQLLNCNLNTAGSSQSRFRGRGGDSFLLSPLYCGSSATGWAPTAEWMRGRMTLSTAMAISGAGVGLESGVQGDGTDKDFLPRMLRTALGLGLGYWAQNPNPRYGKRSKRLPNFLFPGLSQGLSGRGLSEQRVYLELTNGGHFDNLGVYELVRRRVELIIAVDACAANKFGSLGNAIEKARVDFGTNIRFDVDQFGLDGIVAGSESEDPITDENSRSRRCFAIATIEYPDGPPGLLVYIKSTMIEGVTGEVLAYRSVNPAFPAPPTDEPAFGEVQFEAYRELGFSLGQTTLREYPELQHRLRDTEPTP